MSAQIAKDDVMQLIARIGLNRIEAEAAILLSERIHAVLMDQASTRLSCAAGKSAERAMLIRSAAVAMLLQVFESLEAA